MEYRALKQELLSTYRNDFDQNTAKWLELKNKSHFSEMLRYVLGASGAKRLRPSLYLYLRAACLGRVGSSALQSDQERSWNIALALELLHLSSLVHDDLPALDNDDFRRGVPSCHIAFGEGRALLFGNYLVAEAFRLVAPYANAAAINSSAEQGGEGGILPADPLSALAVAWGELNTGQCMEIAELDAGGEDNRIGGKVSLEQRIAIFKKKTGALFAASWGLSALGTPLSALFPEFWRCGEMFGVVFQLADDLADALPDGKGLEDKEESGLYGYDAQEMARRAGEGVYQLKSFLDTYNLDSCNEIRTLLEELCRPVLSSRVLT